MIRVRCDRLTRRISRPYLVPSGTCIRPSDGCRIAEFDPRHVVHYKHGLEPTVKSCLTISCNRGGERFVNRPTRLTRGHSSLGSKTQLGLPSPRESIIADQLQNVNRSMKKCNSAAKLPRVSSLARPPPRGSWIHHVAPSRGENAHAGAIIAPHGQGAMGGIPLLKRYNTGLENYVKI